MSDSATRRDRLVGHLSQDPELTVLGVEAAAASGSHVAPPPADVIVSSVTSRVPAAELARSWSGAAPLLVVADPADNREVAAAFDACLNGALDVAALPSTDDAVARELRAQIRRLTAVGSSRQSTNSSPARARRVTPEPVRDDAERPPALVVGVVGSVGGLASIVSVVAGLNARFAGCLAIVQHLPAGFVPGFRSFLSRHAPLPVHVAASAVTVSPGTIVVAAEGTCLAAVGPDVLGPSQEDHWAPGDLLLHSLAETWGRHAVGVLLSGFGDDGSAGLLAMRRAGALTIVESRDTAAAYAGPRAALERGAALRALAARDIGAMLQGAAAEHIALRTAARARA